MCVSQLPLMHVPACSTHEARMHVPACSTNEARMHVPAPPMQPLVRGSTHEANSTMTTSTSSGTKVLRHTDMNMEVAPGTPPLARFTAP